MRHEAGRLAAGCGTAGLETGTRQGGQAPSGVSPSGTWTRERGGACALATPRPPNGRGAVARPLLSFHPIVASNIGPNQAPFRPIVFSVRPSLGFDFGRIRDSASPCDSPRGTRTRAKRAEVARPALHHLLGWRALAEDLLRYRACTSVTIACDTAVACAPRQAIHRDSDLWRSV